MLDKSTRCAFSVKIETIFNLIVYSGIILERLGVEMRRTGSRILAWITAFILVITPVMGVPISVSAELPPENIIVFDHEGLSFDSDERLMVHDSETGLWNHVNHNKSSDDIVPEEVLASADSLEHAQEIANAYGLVLLSYYHGIAVMQAQNAELAVFQSLMRRTLDPNRPILGFNWVYTIDFVDSDETSTMIHENTVHDPWTIQPWLSPNLRYGEVYHGTDIDASATSVLAVTSPHSVNMDHWQHEVMDNYRAWDISTGSGVTVAVIDTGIDINHPAFAGRILPNSFNSHTNQIGLLAVRDDEGHGTHVSGIVAAAPTAFSDVSGVAPEAYIMKIKANDPASPRFFTSAALQRGINYAVANGADIINMSLGRDYAAGPDPQEHSVIINAINQGVTIIAAAGNSSDNRAGFPAAYPEVIAVSSVWMGPNGPAFDGSYSNFGPDIDLAAPGTDVLAPIRGGEYDRKTGTSMAAPNVAGAAALVLSENPGLSPQLLRNRLNNTARQAGMLGGDLRYGHGIVSSYAALLGPDNLHRVTYHLDDGLRDPVTVRIATGASLIPPARHVSGGRILTDWSTSRGGPVFAFNSLITADINLFANWVDAEFYGFWVVEFPDINFRRTVQQLLTEMDGVIRTDISPMNTVDTFLLSTIQQLALWGMSGSEFRDMTGLRHFPNLTHLNLNSASGGSRGGHLLTTLDLSYNPNLQWLDISNNLSLRDINVSNNPQLTTLRAWQAFDIRNMDLSNNRALEVLVLNGAPAVSEIDFSNHPLLRFFQIQWGAYRMDSIDLSNNPLLEHLSITSHNLTQIDLSHNPLLSVGLQWNNLSSINLSNNVNLTALSLSGNNFANLDLSQNINLVSLNLSQNNFINLDLSQHINLAHLFLSENSLTNIDLSQNINLVRLNLSENNLTNLDFTNNPELALLNVSDNQLTSLNISNNPNLRQLIVSNNKIAALDLSNNARLGTDTILDGTQVHFGLLWADNNRLTSLDISNTSHNWNRNTPAIPVTRLNLSANYIPTIDNVVGWQGRGLILANNFIFDPQRISSTPGIMTGALPNGRIGAMYKQQLIATGGGITWNIVGGSLPAGLSLASAGTISGIPLEYGTFEFTIGAYNDVGFATATFALTVDFAPIDGVIREIRTAEELAAIGSAESLGGYGYYILMNDIHLTNEWVPIDNFMGVFDGRGHAIYGLHVLESSGRVFAGLFGTISNADVTIKNLRVYLGSQGVTAANPTGFDASAGGLVGVVNHATLTISNSYAKGDIFIINVSRSGGWGQFAGGLVGGVMSGGSRVTISTSFADCNISISNGLHRSAAGGLIGLGSVHMIISNSYAMGNVVASGGYMDTFAGGLVGAGGGHTTLINSYATSNVTALRHFLNTPAGVAGSLAGNAPLGVERNSYSLSSQVVTGRTINNLGTPLTETQMRQQSSFVGWDFDNIWTFRTGVNNGFPVLREVVFIVDRTALRAAIEDAESKIEANYTYDSWSLMQTRLHIARNVYDNAIATQSRVDDVAHNLQAAINALVDVSTVDRTALRAAIEDAESRIEANYTPDSWSFMQITLNTARNVYNNANATQSQVNDAAYHLQAAINALEDDFPSIATETLLYGRVGVRYNQQLIAANAGITWSIVGGSLPEGLTLASAGTISGIPLEYGTFEFTIRASNTAGFVTATFALMVDFAPIDGVIREIRTAEELAAIGGTRSEGGYYVLMNDIHLTNEWVPVNHFRGVLDGRGHAIYGLYVLESSERVNAGLFGTVPNADVTIKNLRVYIGSQGVTAITPTEHNMGNAGGLVGSVGSNSTLTIINTSVKGDVFVINRGRIGGVGFGQFAGGLVGGTTLDDSSKVTISTSFTDSNVTIVNGFNLFAAGGLIGRGSDPMIISNSYATGNIVTSGSGTSNASAFAGGLVGTGGGSITLVNSYATGNVSATDNVSAWRDFAGGLIGHTPFGIERNSYRLDTQIVTGRTINNLGTLLNQTQMRQQSSFVGWDFDNIWTFRPGTNNGFPVLREVVFVEVPTVDRTALRATIEEAEIRTEVNYTPDSWSWMQTMLYTARNVYSNTNATQSQVDSAANNLQVAINALVEVPTVDRTALRAAIEDAESRIETNYTSASWSFMQIMLNTARNVYSNANATQSQVDSAANNLQVAINALVDVSTVDRTALRAAIEDAESRIEANYTSDSWSWMQTMLNVARNVYNDANATQSLVDDVANNLQSAIDALVEVPIIPVVDRTALRAAIEDAESRIEANYTPDSWLWMQTMLYTARNVYDNADATQSQVDDAAYNLRAAIDALEEETISLVIVTETLPNGRVGVTYNQQLIATDDGITWSLTNGSLPEGLTLASAGTISGIPLEYGTFNFTIMASNDVGFATTTFVLTVDFAPLAGVIREIRTAEELAAIGGMQSQGGYYILMNDIHLTNEWVPIDNFRGIFDGRGHAIYGLYVLESSERSRAGLFGTVYADVTIKNLRVYIDSQGVTANATRHAYAGGLVGLVETSATLTIVNSSVKGDVFATCSGNGWSTISAGGLVGGIALWFVVGIGHHDRVTISTSFTDSNVTIVNGRLDSAVGGLIGIGSSRMIISNSYATGNVVASGLGVSAGGLVGYEFGSTTLVNSYATGNVSAPQGTAGGVSGGDEFFNIVRNSYRLSSQIVTGDFINNLGTPLTETQMRQQSSFVGWDFDNIWTFRPGTNNGFPVLREVVFVEDKDITDAFECPNFLAYVRGRTNRPYPQRIFRGDVEGIELISLPYRPEAGILMDGVTSLAGIEYFTALKWLIIPNHELSEIDVSSNPYLITLSVSGNPLVALNISNNPRLEQLHLHYHNDRSLLTELDLSNNLELRSLIVRNDSNYGKSLITELNISSNPSLYHLDVSGNQLTRLDVSNNPALSSLNVSRNQLTELDVSNNPALYSLDVSRNQLTELDISNNPALYSLYVAINLLTGLDISNNHNLTRLWASRNYMTTPDNVVGWRYLFSHPCFDIDPSSNFWFWPQRTVSPPDTSALRIAIEEAESRIEANYTPDSWLWMQTMLYTAINVYDNADATQYQVDDAAYNLQAAIDALEEVPTIPVVDRTALRAAIEAAKSKIEANYTPDSWSWMQAMFYTARNVYDNADATQSQVDDAANNLQAAINALVEIQSKDITITFVVEAGAVGVYLETTTTVVVPAGEVIPASAIPNTDARTGFYFAGWYPADPTGFVVTEDVTFTARFTEIIPVVPQIISVTPNPAVVEQGGMVEILITTQGMPDGTWVDLNVTWRHGLSVVEGPRFYIVDNQATITVAAAENTNLGRDGFAVAARTTGDWGSIVIIDSYVFVIEII